MPLHDRAHPAIHPAPDLRRSGCGLHPGAYRSDAQSRAVLGVLRDLYQAHHDELQIGINVVYRTCGNTMHLVEKMARSGVNGPSLDSREAGVDLAAVARSVPEDVVVIGNVNPVAAMRFGSPADVRREANALLGEMEKQPNFILSTGCDLPEETPVANIREFHGGRKGLEKALRLRTWVHGIISAQA